MRPGPCADLVPSACCVRPAGLHPCKLLHARPRKTSSSGSLEHSDRSLDWECWEGGSSQQEGGGRVQHMVDIVLQVAAAYLNCRHEIWPLSSSGVTKTKELQSSNRLRAVPARGVRVVLKEVAPKSAWSAAAASRPLRDMKNRRRC